MDRRIRIDRLFVVALVLDERIEHAGIDWWQWDERNKLVLLEAHAIGNKLAGKVIGGVNQIVAWFLIGTEYCIITLAGVKVELPNRQWLNILTVQRDQRHVVLCDLDLPILRIATRA